MLKTTFPTIFSTSDFDVVDLGGGKVAGNYGIGNVEGSSGKVENLSKVNNTKNWLCPKTLKNQLSSKNLQKL